MSSFHEVRFPTSVALGARGGPERRTDIVRLGSGAEERNSRWAHSRRRYNAGYGVKSFADLSASIAFFEERRGRLYGFRWHDRLDGRSCSPHQNPTPLDQWIGNGNGTQSLFQLAKTYGAAHAPYVRVIQKPVAGSVRVAVAGVERTLGTHFTLNAANGQISFLAGHIPASGASVTAGYQFDVPVRFDTDRLDIDLSAFEAGEIPNIPLVEIMP